LRQLVVNTTGGAALVGVSGTLDAVTVNGNLDLFASVVNVINGLVLNGLARVGHPSNGGVGSLVFNGSQAISGSGSVVFGNSGCNTLRVPLATTILTNRLLIHGNNGQIGFSTCVGGVYGNLVNEGTISADVNNGTITIRVLSFINNGTTNSLNGGRLLLTP